jgi:hypothetical protein
MVHEGHDHCPLNQRQLHRDAVAALVGRLVPGNGARGRGEVGVRQDDRRLPA